MIKKTIISMATLAILGMSNAYATDYCKDLPNNVNLGELKKNGESLNDQIEGNASFNPETGTVTLRLYAYSGQPERYIAMTLYGSCKNMKDVQLKQETGRPAVNLELTGTAGDGRIDLKGKGNDGAIYELKMFK